MPTTQEQQLIQAGVFPENINELITQPSVKDADTIGNARIREIDALETSHGNSGVADENRRRIAANEAAGLNFGDPGYQTLLQATPGDKASLDAELLSFQNIDTGGPSIYTGQDVPFQSFSDDEATPQQRRTSDDFFTRPIEEREFDRYGRELYSNPAYAQALLERGLAVPYNPDNKVEALALTKEAKKNRLGAWKYDNQGMLEKFLLRNRGLTPEGTRPGEVTFENAAKGFLSGALNLGAKTGSAFGEILESFGEAESDFLDKEQARLDRSFPGEQVSDWRKTAANTVTRIGTTIQEAYTDFQREGFADRISGYDTYNVDQLTKEVGVDIDNGNYIQAIGKAIADPRALEVLVNSLPEMGALAVSVGSLALINANNNINIGEAELGRNFTSNEKVRSFTASVVGTYLDRLGDKLAISGVTPAKLALKEAIDKAGPATKRYLGNVYGKAILKIGEAPLRLAGAGIVEGITEKGQTLAEIAAREPRVFEEGFTEADVRESDIAGVLGAAAGTHLSAPRVAVETAAPTLKAVSDITRTGLDQAAQTVERRRQERATDSSINAIRAQDNTYGEDASVTPSESTFKSPSELKTEVSSDAEFDTALDRLKQENVAQVFDVNPRTGRVIGLSEQLQGKTPAEISAAVANLKTWVNEYSNEFKSNGRFLDSNVENFVNHINSDIVTNIVSESALETVLDTEAAQTAQTIAEDEEYVSSLGSTQEEIVNNLEQDLTFTNTVETTNADGTVTTTLKRPKEVIRQLAERTARQLQVSGFALAEGLTATLDPRFQTIEESGLKLDTRSRAQSNKTPIVDSTIVTGNVLNSILDNGVTDSILEGLNIDTNNTKVGQFISKRLDDAKQGIDNNLSESLKNTGGKIKQAVADFDKTRVNNIFRGEDVDSNLTRLGVIALNTINAATESDTLQRVGVAGVSDSRVLPNEYYASLSNVLTQIGKDYTSSYGIQVEGDPVGILKSYRDIGRAAIDMLSQEGIDLIETTDRGGLLTRVGENTFSKDNRKLSAERGAKSFKHIRGKDSITGSDVLLVEDTGIRLTGTNPIIDNNDLGRQERGYENQAGDAIKRISRLLLPWNIRTPSKEPVTSEIVTDPSVVLDENAERVINNLRKEPLRIDAKFRPMLDVIEETREKYDGSLHRAINANKWLADLLDIDTTGTELLRASEVGSNMAKIRSIDEILDNLDNLDGDLFFEYQVDINNRITVMETVLNFQHDKVFSRQILTRNKEYKVETDEAKEYFLNNIIEELGIAKTAEAYASVKDSLLNPNKEDLNPAVRRMKSLIEYRNSNVSEVAKIRGTALNVPAGFSGGLFKYINLLNAVEDVLNADENGSFTSTHMIEMDANASGVINTLLNISGRAPEEFKKILSTLGVSFKDRKAGRFTDAYSRLQRAVTNSLRGGLTAEESARLEQDGVTLGDTDIKELISELNKLGIDSRELAKSPVMTWFYSAGVVTITKELTASIIDNVVSKAVNGNKKAIEHLANALDKTDLTVDDIKAIKPRSREHIRLINKYDKIGEIYNENLDTAFPFVTEYKNEMGEIFKLIEANSKHDGQDLWGGTIRSAITAVNEGRTMDDGTTSLYKVKNTDIGLSPEEKVQQGLTYDEEGLELLTTSTRASNISSVLPLQAQNIDSGLLLGSIDGKLQERGRDGEGMLTVHDAIYGNPEELLDIKEVYEDLTLEYAVDYDMVDNMILSGETVVAKLKALRGTTNNLQALNAKISRLEQGLAQFKAANDPRIEAKKELFDDAETNVFGMQKIEALGTPRPVTTGTTTEATEITSAPVRPVRREPVLTRPRPTPTVEARPETEIVTPSITALDKFNASRKTVRDVTNLLKDLSTDESLQLLEDVEKKEVTFRAFDDKAKQELRSQLGTKEFSRIVNTSYPFFLGNTIYMVDNPSIDGNIASVMSVLSHEIEHAMSDRYIEQASTKRTREYKVLESLMKRLATSDINTDLTSSGYIYSRVNNIASKLKNAEGLSDLDVETAIKELVATYREGETTRTGVLRSLGNITGIGAGTIGRALKAIRQSVFNLFNGKISYKEIVDEIGSNGNAIDMSEVELAINAISIKARENANLDPSEQMSQFSELIKGCSK